MHRSTTFAVGSALGMTGRTRSSPCARRYPIPNDGPVGAIVAATGRHPRRPAHIHVIIGAEGYQTLIIDRDSDYLDSDTVFAVKPSLPRTFDLRDPADPERPPDVDGRWCSLECTLSLTPDSATWSTCPGGVG